MKKLKALFDITILLIFTLLIPGCSNSFDLMMGEYNNQYPTPDTSVLPGDTKFDESDMLKDIYFVRTDMTLNLMGPIPREGSNYTYQWTLRKPGSSEINFAKLTDHSTYTTMRFVMYIPDSGVKAGSYKLTLTVNKEDQTFTDTCTIVIYEE